MKSLLFLTSLFLSSNLINAQYSYFNNRYNHDYFSSGWSILEDESGYIISGVSGEAPGEYIFLRIVLTKIDHEGSEIWWKTYGEDFHNYYAGNSRSTDKTWDDGFILGGTIEDSIRTVGLLMKFDQNGDMMWSKIFGDTTSTNFTGTKFNLCRELPDHGFILVGSKYISGDDGDIKIVRTDSLGTTIWEQTYGQLHIVEEGYSVAHLPDNGFIVGFQSKNLHWNYSSQPGILKVDSLGNQKWIKYYGSTMDDYGCSVALSQDGNYLFGSAYAITQPGPDWPQQKARIIKTDTSGNIIWERKYGKSLFTGNSCTIDELPDGTIIESGQGGFDDSMNWQGWILKVEPDGDSIWMRRYDYYHANNGYLNSLHDISIAIDNGIIFTGEVWGEPEWEQSIWVQKLDSIGCDSTGCDTTVGIIHLNQRISHLGKFKIYPNPASDWIHILFIEDNPNWFSERNMEIFNVFGEKVLTINIPNRSMSYDFNVSNLTPGIYLLIIRERQNVIYNGKILIAR
jgi:hypothetical protein